MWRELRERLIFLFLFHFQSFRVDFSQGGIRFIEFVGIPFQDDRAYTAAVSHYALAIDRGRDTTHAAALQFAVVALHRECARTYTREIERSIARNGEMTVAETAHAFAVHFKARAADIAEAGRSHAFEANI